MAQRIRAVGWNRVANIMMRRTRAFLAGATATVPPAGGFKYRVIKYSAARFRTRHVNCHRNTCTFLSALSLGKKKKKNSFFEVPRIEETFPENVYHPLPCPRVPSSLTTSFGVFHGVFNFTAMNCETSLVLPRE